MLYLSAAKERLQRHLLQRRVCSSETHPCETMADPGGLNLSLARLKLSLGGNGFEDALAAFVAKARNANERCAAPASS